MGYSKESQAGPEICRMYESFFQLTKAPFSLVSDPGCIHVTPKVRDVLRTLVYGVLERRGCLALIADPGLGKTTLLRSLGDFLIDSNAQSSTILTPTVSPSEFLELLMLNFGIEEIPDSKARRLRILEKFLIEADERDVVSALIVDEAHKLGDELLEEIRLLGNFESGNRKLLQIVLAGQSELNDRLSRPDLWQFKQRISARLTLTPLDRQSVADYVRFRWAEAGESPLPFNDSAMRAIAAWSSGVPRMINIICHNALQMAHSQNRKTVDHGMIEEASLELALPVPIFDSDFADADTAVQSNDEPLNAPSVESSVDLESTGHRWASFWRGSHREESPQPARRRRPGLSILPSLEDPAE